MHTIEYQCHLEQKFVHYTWEITVVYTWAITYKQSHISVILLIYRSKKVASFLVSTYNAHY